MVWCCVWCSAVRCGVVWCALAIVDQHASTATARGHHLALVPPIDHSHVVQAALAEYEAADTAMRAASLHREPFLAVVAVVALGIALPGRHKQPRRLQRVGTGGTRLDLGHALGGVHPGVGHAPLAAEQPAQPTTVLAVMRIVGYAMLVWCAQCSVSHWCRRVKMVNSARHA